MLRGQESSGLWAAGLGLQGVKAKDLEGQGRERGSISPAVFHPPVVMGWGQALILRSWGINPLGREQNRLEEAVQGKQQLARSTTLKSELPPC